MGHYYKSVSTAFFYGKSQLLIRQANQSELIWTSKRLRWSEWKVQSAASFSYGFRISRVVSFRTVLLTFIVSVEQWETNKASSNWFKTAFFYNSIYARWPCYWSFLWPLCKHKLIDLTIFACEFLNKIGPILLKKWELYTWKNLTEKCMYTNHFPTRGNYEFP